MIADVVAVLMLIVPIMGMVLSGIYVYILYKVVTPNDVYFISYLKCGFIGLTVVWFLILLNELNTIFEMGL